MKKKVLVTGFAPFGGETVNPSYLAVSAMKEENTGAVLIKKEVPVTFADAIPFVTDLMRKEHPDLVIAVGQAGGRNAVTPERIAINIDDARIPDNAGEQPVDQPIDPEGPAAYFSLLPVKKIVKEIRNLGIPAAVSNSAGTFVCNHLMYGILEAISKEFPDMRGGFIHVPYLPEQVKEKPGTFSMPVELITEALECAVRVALSEIS